MSNNKPKNNQHKTSPKNSTDVNSEKTTSAVVDDAKTTVKVSADKVDSAVETAKNTAKDATGQTAAPSQKDSSENDNSSTDDMSRKNRRKTPAKPHANSAKSNAKADNTLEEKENQPKDNAKADLNSSAKVEKKANVDKTVDAEKHTEKTAEKPIDTQAKVTPHPPVAQKTATQKKSGGVLPVAALLLGVAGTGIGVYNFDQIRTLKGQDNTSELVAKLNEAEAKITALSARNTDALEAKIETLSGDASALKDTSKRVTERLSAIEQTQNGLSKTLHGDLNKTLDDRLNEINALLKKIDQIEMTQEGLAQNLNQVTAAGEAVTATGMAKQEVGYLLRMADYKIESEGDAPGAAGLIKIAEDKLLLINKGQVTPLISSIRQKLTQLAGVQPVDPDSIIRDLKTVSRDIPNLVAKSNPQASDSSDADMKKAATDGETSILESIGNVIASGVKFTPNDPSKIDISAETVLIEKRLMQADIRTAELAVRSQNQVLLAESLRSVKDSLDKYFTADETAKSIGKVLADIEQRKLETVLPDLSTLVKQFEGRQ